MPELRRRYDPEFRSGAVRIILETGKPFAQVARDIGVHAGTLGNWVKKERLASEADGQLGEDSSAELVRLRKEVAELRMGLDVLKRSVVLWVTERDAMSVVSQIAAQRTGHGVPHAVTCRLPGRQRIVVLQVAQPPTHCHRATPGRARYQGADRFRDLGTNLWEPVYRLEKSRFSWSQWKRPTQTTPPPRSTPQRSGTAMAQHSSVPF